LKSKVEESRSDLPAARQKLIHSGKVLKDEQLVSELGIADSDFIVCMITKEVAKVSDFIAKFISGVPRDVFVPYRLTESGTRSGIRARRCTCAQRFYGTYRGCSLNSSCCPRL
jgi:hypothetical protein